MAKDTSGATEHFGDRLLAACRDKAPVCVGLDPVLERLPAELDRSRPIEAIRAFCLGVLDATAGHAAAVKLQSACFERYRGPGFELMFELLEAARERGVLTIADAKRGDIGTSSAHYAAALLGGGDRRVADAVTVSPYLGGDGLEPFLDAAQDVGGGLFALVRTSNPGGDAVQRLALADGRTVAEAVADLVARWGEAEPGRVGRSGFSLLGAVVGATQAADAGKLRARMPRQWLLVPGFGAQGGGPEDVLPCFKDDGTGALVTASRSVLYAFDAEAAGVKRSWQAAVAAAAGALAAGVRGVLGR